MHLQLNDHESTVSLETGREAYISELLIFSLTVEPNDGPPFLYDTRNSTGYPFNFWGMMPRSSKVRAAKDVSEILQQDAVSKAKRDVAWFVDEILTIFWDKVVHSECIDLV